MILYINLPGWVQGMALTPNLILIDKDRKGDAALLAHEQVHCEQMEDIGMFRFWFRYLTDKTFRQFAEVEAYRVSYKHTPERLAQFAEALSTRYRLNLSHGEASRLIAPVQTN